MAKRLLERLSEDQGGIVLVITLLLLALLMATSVGVIYSTQTNLKISGNLKIGRQAFYIAEAGVHRVWQELDSGETLNSFEKIWGGPVEVLLYGNEAFAGGSHRVALEKIPKSVPRRVKVISTGCFPAGHPCPAGNARAVIESHFSRGPLFPGPVSAVEEVSLGGGARTDSFDSRLAPYDPVAAGDRGDVTSDGRINLSGSTTLVNGRATAAGAVVLAEGAKVTGEVAGNVRPQRFTRFKPCGPPYSDGAGISGGNYHAATGRLEAQAGESIVLANGSYCFSAVILPSGSSISVSGPVIIQLTGPGTFAEGALVNTTGLAENFKIFSSFSDPTEEMVLSGGNQAHATVYAPGSRVVFSGAGDFYGAVVGKTVVSTGGVRFHYDEKLKDNEDGPVRLTVWKDAL